MSRPVYLISEPEDVYHARSKSGEVLSSHMLALFRQSPRLYQLTVTGQLPAESSPAFAFGRAAHAMVLEGREAFNERYVVNDGPVNSRTGEPYGRTTKAYQEWAAGQTGEVIGTAEADAVDAMALAVHNHPVAGLLTGNIVPEAVVREQVKGIPCQIRLDGFSEKYGIIDLKTCADISTFYWDIGRYGYVNQLAFYRQVLRLAAMTEHQVYIVAVEKKAPYTVGVWHLSPDVLDVAEAVNDKALAQLAQCRESGVWPTGYEELREYDLKFSGRE